MARIIQIFSFALITILCFVWAANSNEKPIENLFSIDPPKGWRIKGSPQTFNKENLFEHINGQADLFFQYGFEQSAFAAYEGKDRDKDRIDVDIYDMGRPLNAFGIFSRFRGGEGAKSKIGLDSYADAQYIVFYKGNYFISLQALEPNARALEHLARAIESNIPNNGARPKELAYFPKEDLLEGTIEYYPNGLLGREFLGRGFKAVYSAQDPEKLDSQGQRAANHEPILFLAIFQDHVKASKAMEAFKKDLAGKDKNLSEISDGQIPKTLKAQDPYQGKMFIQLKDRYIIGAAGFNSEKRAESFLKQILSNL